MELYQLAHDILGPHATMQGLLNFALDKNIKEDKKEISTRIDTCLGQLQKINDGRKLKLLKDTKNKNEILLKGEDKMEIIDLNKIVYITESNNGCDLYIAKNNEPKNVCILIGKLEEQLATIGFLKINGNTIINSKYIRACYRKINFYVIMKTGEEFEVSRRKFPQLKKVWISNFG